MKKVLVMAATALALVSCGGSATEQKSNADSTQAAAVDTAGMTFYGEKITPDSAISIGELAALMGDKTELNCKVSGEIEAVCQKKGCWMDIKNPNGESIRITFKDYGFFMPKDASGKKAIMQGIAKVEETSVADLQEYAKDAGKAEAEVKAITAPKKELVFEASGVILQ
jgi:hypothetical protein